jgi:hypothetical protein
VIKYYVEKRRKRKKIFGDKKIGDEVQIEENLSNKKERIERGKEDRRQTKRDREERREKRIVGNINDR